MISTMCTINGPSKLRIIPTIFVHACHLSLCVTHNIITVHTEVCGITLFEYRDFITLAVCFSGNGAAHITEVALRRAGLFWDGWPSASIPSWYWTNYLESGQLSLAVPRSDYRRRFYGYRQGRKRRVLRNSRPCCQDWWVLTYWSCRL